MISITYDQQYETLRFAKRNGTEAVPELKAPQIAGRFVRASEPEVPDAKAGRSQDRDPPESYGPEKVA
jgi:hypothetical protein